MAKGTREAKKEVPVHADPPPAVVSEPRDYQYETGEQLGKGGFAICHRATILERGKQTGMIVALKIVKTKMEPAKLAQKFATELQLHSKLHHPNIVEFHRAFAFQTSTYVVLEICDNGSLADAIKKRKYFTMPEIRRFIIQTCGAVKYLHARHIVHRDLKTGNLFLDKDMNIKVGDFGLAALLVDQHDIGKRRTTMCGTPNYLAPEILEKSGKGHNEKVDLWAIGIIAFTLAVGKAPFHAAKREDIYKKLQARDYNWPELSTSPNEISNDLHDLVSSLLVPEDDRPSPDQIVSHPFFKMTYIPERLSSSCTKIVPKWPDVKPPNTETIRRGYTDAWYRLCLTSGVGEYAPGKTFQMFGGKRIKSIVRECEKELLAGREPKVPMPQGMVYLPFVDSKQEQRKAELSQIAEEKEPSSQEHVLVETTANNRSAPPRRAASKTTRRLLAKEISSERVDAAEVISSEPVSNESMRPRKTSTTSNTTEPKLATAMTLARSNSKSKSATLGASTRPTAARTASATERRPAQRATSAPKAPRLVDSGHTAAVSERPIDRPAEIIDLADSGSSSDAEPQEEMDPSSPAAVLARVARFRDNIQKALSGQTPGPRRTSKAPKLPFVTKWVDYAKKHGIGYVLDDGTVGISINASGTAPVVHAMVKDGLSYLHRVTQKPEMLANLPLEAYEDQGEEGLVRIELERKRRDFAAVLWTRFGKYMVQVSGDDIASALQTAKNGGPTRFVRFYQRIAGVGIWAFDDGCLQLNFPDHTKLVLSHDGKHCDFTYLKPVALAYLKKDGELPLKHMAERGVMSQSIATLMSIDANDGAEGLIVHSNSLRAKLTFVATLVDDWINNGGLGCSSPLADRLQWTDASIKNAHTQQKKYAVTIGRYGGDARAGVAAEV